MDAVAIIAQIAGGLRLALVLLAIMGSMTSVRGAPRMGAKRTDLVLALKVRAEGWYVAAVLAYSPVHAAWLLGRPAPHLVSRTADMLASGSACGVIILFIAARALRRGLSARRARRGAMVNGGVVLATVVAAWAVR